ncbi:MAG: FIST N-terminal domain-containing protein [Gammaproteobacteria bacterium]
MSQQHPTNARDDRFLSGHAQSPDWEKAAESCLQQAGYIPPEANLGFLYASDDLAAELGKILDWFRAETGIRDWVGTVGRGLCASGHEYYAGPALSMLIGEFPPGSYRLLPSLRDPGLGGLADLQDWLYLRPGHFAIVHGDPGHGSLPELIAQLAAHLPGGYLVGGLTSSRHGQPQIANGIVEGGLSGVVFDDRVKVITGLTQGCSPIAGRHVITAARRNIIVEIDGRPALDVFYEDIGEILARDLARTAGYIFAGLPLPGPDTGDYLVRNLIGVDTQTRQLAIGDLVEPGRPLQFCRRDGRTAWEDMQRMLDGLKARCDRPPRGGLYYSCLGRGQQLFGQASDELRAIRTTLGDFPLAGFFASGEISNNRLYGYTGVLTLFF